MRMSPCRPCPYIASDSRSTTEWQKTTFIYICIYIILCDTDCNIYTVYYYDYYRTEEAEQRRNEKFIMFSKGTYNTSPRRRAPHTTPK